MSNKISAENPWDWLGPHDIRRFGETIMDPAERARWCRAVLICGLPYMWKHKAGAFRDLMYSKLELRPGQKVFLLGEGNEDCGFEADLKKRVGSSGEVQSVDIMEKARTTSAQGVKGRGGVVGTWRYDYAEKFPDNHFDSVAVIQAIQHCDDWHECARDVIRVLKPGGTIILTEIGVSDRTRAAAELDLHLEYWMEKLYFGTGRRGPEEVSYYSPAQLHDAFKGLVKDAGDVSWRGIDLVWGTKI